MKILIIRHGEPTSPADGITEKGEREVEILAKKIGKMDIKQCYVSPLIRAQKTAAPSLKALGQADTAITCEWLREFAPRIDRPDKMDSKVCWDWLPQDWTSRPYMYDRVGWREDPVLKAGKVPEEYDWVTENFDKVLAQHGYERDGMLYKAVNPNNDTIAFFCHFGLQSVLLSHLMGISPVILWHNTCALPSSVTTIFTEERRPGIASFRMGSFGDLSHLYAADEPASFKVRFCECYMNEDERHDDY